MIEGFCQKLIESTDEYDIPEELYKRWKKAQEKLDKIEAKIMKITGLKWY